MKQVMMEWHWHQLDHMQIKSPIRHRRMKPSQHLITEFFTGQMLFLMPSQQCQSTEGKSELHLIA